MGKLLRAAVGRWLASEPRDSSGGEMELWKPTGRLAERAAAKVEKWIPGRALQSTPRQKLVLNPATGQIKPKLEPLPETKQEPAARESLMKRIWTAQAADETTD
jgi:hypothetical protein